MTAILICGGTLSAGFLSKVREQYKDAVVYAVDGGLAVADAAGILPDYLVGDFDTAEEGLVMRYENRCVTIRHKPEKDATDTELAVDEALERGAEHIVLLGATGSRMDFFSYICGTYVILQPIDRFVCRKRIINAYFVITGK